MLLLIDYAGYIAAKAASFLFRLMPVSVGLWIARRLSLIVYFSNGKRRAVAYQNMKAAFGATLSSRDIRRITSKVYQNLLQTLAEVLAFPRVNKKYLDKFITFEGVENLEKAKKRGKGIIFLTAHYGNWELLSVAGGLMGYRMLVLAREQKHSRLNELVNRYRELTGSRVIRKGFAVKDMLLALKNNEIIGMLVDQDAGRKGVFVDFFGRKTSFAHGPMSFALKTGATILPVFIVREKGPCHRIAVGEPVEMVLDGGHEDAVRRGTQKFAEALQHVITQHPEQWLWLHKRWKSTPTKKILVLGDGKAGHLNQSLAVAEMIREIRSDAGYGPQDTALSVAEAGFKNSKLKTLLNLSSIFSSKGCQGCTRCLRFFLSEKSYKALMKEYADFIISCGSSTEGINAFMSKELGAKSIIIMKPSLLGIDKFDLAIIPGHDKAGPHRKAVFTEGAPNRMTEQRLARDSALLAKRINLEKPVRIGLLIGGDNPEYSLTAEIMNELMDALIEAASRIDAEILATTSRRTPREAEGILKNRLARHPRGKLLVIAGEENLDEAVAGILGLSQIAVVSGESVSMVSEAASAPGYTFVFELQKRKNGVPKHERFLSGLAGGGYIYPVKAGGLSVRIGEVWKEKPPIKRLDDRKRIREALVKIL